MKRRSWPFYTLFLLLFPLFSLLLPIKCLAAEETKPADTIQKESYSLGYQVGETIRKQELEVNMEMLTRGIRDGVAGKKGALTPEEIRETLKNIQKKTVAAQQKAYERQAAKNLADGQAWLAENGKKEGVKTLASGLQYKVQVEGKGRIPKETDTVQVNYRGTFIDGTEFDNSWTRGKPETLRVNGVIPAWTEALQLMKEGSKWELAVPPSLGYGERGLPPRIGPNSTLVFEVELVSIEEAKQ